LEEKKFNEDKMKKEHEEKKKQEEESKENEEIPEKINGETLYSEEYIQILPQLG
jgi:hypothetical protein